MKTALVMALVMSLVLVGSVIGVVEETAPTTAGVTVNEFLSVTLSNDPVQFPGADPLETVNASVGTGFPLTLTIGSESNVNANVKTKGAAEFCTDYPTCSGTGGEYKFAVGQMKWDDATTGPWTSYTTLDVSVCASVAPGSACNIYHQLTIPSAQAAGSYSTGITITATSV